MGGKEIIDLKPEERDNGEIVYEQTTLRAARDSGVERTVKKILGWTVGLVIFVTLLVFFVYVVVPLILIIVVVIFLRKIYHSLTH